MTYVLTRRERRQVVSDLAAASKNLTLATELIVKSYRSPSSWILGSPSPRELDCGMAAVPLKLAHFHLGLERRRRGEQKWVALFTSWRDARAINRVSA